jgi:hypothetical protein
MAVGYTAGAGGTASKEVYSAGWASGQNCSFKLSWIFRGSRALVTCP